jgi:hypothetical protein
MGLHVTIISAYVLVCKHGGEEERYLEYLTPPSKTLLEEVTVLHVVRERKTGFS